MDNQHRKISGYRELTQDEIDLMNTIKREGVVLEALVQKVRETDAEKFDDDSSVVAESARWQSIAKTHFQQGLMALTRAVAKPDFF